MSLLDTLKQVYKTTGVKPDELREQVLPEWGDSVWNLFVALSKSRDYVDGYPLGIKPTEIKAHCFLAGIELNAIEYDLLTDLDSSFLRAQKDNKNG